MFFFYFHNLFTIETITHLHIKYLNLNTFKISTYEKNVIFPPGKQPNACLPRQILGTPCTSHLVLLFYQASTMKNVVVMFEGQLPPLLSRQSSTLPLPGPTTACRTCQDSLMPPRKVRE